MLKCIHSQKPHNLKKAPVERARSLATLTFANALAVEPRVIVADETAGNFDTTRPKEIMGLLCQLRRDRALTIIMVTHKEEMAVHADRLNWMVDSKLIHDSMNGMARRVQLRGHRHTQGQRHLLLRF